MFGRGRRGSGGHDLDWYCSGDPAADTAIQPVFGSHAAELNELLGAAGYRELARHAQAYLDGIDTLAAECSTTE